MLNKESILEDRRDVEEQLKEKSGSNIVVDWMSEIRGLARDGYTTPTGTPRMKDEKFQRIIGICDKSNSMDFNCSSSGNWYENYTFAMVFVGVFITVMDELKV